MGEKKCWSNYDWAYRYYTKPVEVVAIKWAGTNSDEMAEFLEDPQFGGNTRFTVARHLGDPWSLTLELNNKTSKVPVGHGGG